MLEEDSILERNSRSKLFNFGCVPTTIELPPSPNVIGPVGSGNVSRRGSRCSLLSCSVLGTLLLATHPFLLSGTGSNCPRRSKRRGDNTPGFVPNLTDPRPPLVSAPATPNNPDLSMRRTAGGGGEAPSG